MTMMWRMMMEDERRKADVCLCLFATQDGI
jgi:hypothetical protein